MKPLVKVHKLGLISYSKALKIQLSLFDAMKKVASDSSLKQKASKSSENASNCLLLLQHEPVYTVGIRSHYYDSKYIQSLQDVLAKQNRTCDIIRTNRGGLITFHGPGQLIAYPIINLAHFASKIPKKSIKIFVGLLEQIIVDTLREFGLSDAHCVPGYPGVWVDNGNRKLAFVGIACKEFVTMHGISINCDCDLSWFDYIESCGLKNKIITSISKELSGCYKVPSHQTKDDISVDRVADVFCRHFENLFDCKLDYK